MQPPPGDSCYADNITTWISADCQQYTGKTKAEMTEFMKTGQGVGARQGARDYSSAGGGDGGGAGAF